MLSLWLNVQVTVGRFSLARYAYCPRALKAFSEMGLSCSSSCVVGALWRTRRENLPETVGILSRKAAGAMKQLVDSERSFCFLVGGKFVVDHPYPSRGDFRVGRNGSACSRWHSGSAVLSSTWWRLIQNIVSWDEVVTVEKTLRANLAPQSYRKLLEACERRLWELHDSGALSAGSLIAFLVSGECPWQVLLLVVRCGAGLSETGAFSLERMTDFLYQVSLHPGRKHPTVPCGQLQSIVDIIEENMANMSSTCLLRGLWGASRIPQLRVGSLMSGVEDLYGQRLGELSTTEVAWFLNASGRISERRERYEYSGRQLCLKFFREHFSRLADFSPRDCLNLLTCFTFAFAKKGFDQKLRQTLHSAFRAMEERLAESMMCFTGPDVSRLCNAFSVLSYSAERFPLKHFLMERMTVIPNEALVSIFHYIAKHSGLDQELCEHVLACISAGLHQWTFRSTNLFLVSLTFKQVRNFRAIKQLTVAVEKEVIRQLHQRPARYSPGRSAAFFLKFIRLGLNASPALQCFFANAIRGFPHLPFQNIAQLVYGVSWWSCYDSNVHNLLKIAMQKTDLSKKSFGLESTKYLCVGFVRLRLVEPVWLCEIAAFCQQNLQSYPAREEIVIIVRSLSQLGFESPNLFKGVQKSLEEHVAAMPLHSRETCTFIDCAWSCVVQDVFPEETLHWLSRLPLFIAELTWLHHQMLHDVDLLCRQKFGKGLLQHSTHEALLNMLKKSHKPVQGGTATVLKDIVSSFTPGHVGINILTAEGCRVSGVVLKQIHGQTAELPSDFIGPSSEDVRKLISRGYQPVAILVLPPRFFDKSLTVSLGWTKVMCRVLERYGWQVIIISVAAYFTTADKKSFLRQHFNNAGINIFSGS